MNRMNNRTPRLATLALMLAALTACTKTDITPNDDLTNALNPSSGAPIAFETGMPSTKATLSDLERDGFTVSVAMYYHPKEADYISLLDNEPVAKKNGSWVYENTRYWFEDSYFYFVGAYNAAFQKMEQEQDGVTRIGYSLEVDTYDKTNQADVGNDILAASYFVNTSVGKPESVPLDFAHLLTRINFSISQDLESDSDNDYYITKVTLLGLNTSAIYTVVPNGENLHKEWILTGGYENSFVANFDGKTALRDQTLDVWKANGGLLLVPQSIPLNKVKIRIDYLYQLKQDEQEDGGGENVKILERYIEEYLPISTDLWKSNSQIRYNLRIAEPTNIKFLAPKIESWGSSQVGGTIIIK